MKRSGIKRRRRTKHQERNAEHADYIAWLHTQPCAACGTRQNIQAAHVGRGGTGMKHGSDAECIPLCGLRFYDWGLPRASYIGCHAAHDQRTGRFSPDEFTTSNLRAWNELAVAVHRGRYEASQAEPRIGVILF